MSNSSSRRSVWSLVLKIIITVATAIGVCSECKAVCKLMRTITLIIIHCSATPEGNPFRRKPADWTTSSTGDSTTSAIISTLHATERSTVAVLSKRSGHTAVTTTPTR